MEIIFLASCRSTDSGLLLSDNLLAYHVDAAIQWRCLAVTAAPYVSG